MAGLRWAFAIWRRAGRTARWRQSQLPATRSRPFEGGLISATDAVFSESWPDETLGKRLKRFLDAAPPSID